MGYDPLKLENQLCFPLYACAREVVKLYTPLLSEIGLTYTQYIAMMVLWERRQINVKSLGEALYLDSGTLTPLLKKLEKMGYLTRQRSSEDERNLIVTITEAGQALKERAKAIPEQIRQCVALDEPEARELYHTLYKTLKQIAHTGEDF